MIRLQQALMQLAADLEVVGARWALVGGLALAAHIEARTTRDLDVAVSVRSDREAEELVRVLRARGYLEHILIEQETTGRLATVRFAAPGEGPDGLVVDLLFASSGLEPEIVAEAVILEVLPGLRIPVIRVGHFIAVKVLAGRPRDLEDVELLLSLADRVERERARAGADLITARGYDRSKDLRTEVDALFASD